VTVLYHFSNVLFAAGYHCDFIIENCAVENLRIKEGSANAVNIMGKTYHSFMTTVSQLKICDFSGEPFKDFEVLKFSMSATMTQLLSSGKFCKLRYDTILV
jgi:hypothetical protein